MPQSWSNFHLPHPVQAPMHALIFDSRGKSKRPDRLIPSYTIWNATVNYNVEKWRTTFFLTTKNLFDRLYIADRARGILPGPQPGIHAGSKFRF
jgi:outer membrane receptor protein involved in Fe transport